MFKLDWTFKDNEIPDNVEFETNFGLSVSSHNMFDAVLVGVLLQGIEEQFKFLPNLHPLRGLV